MRACRGAAKTAQWHAALAVLLLTSLAAQTISAESVISYTVSNTNAMRGNCYSSGRCVSNLNDGDTNHPEDWLTSGLNSGNIPATMWVIMDLGASNMKCVTKIGIWNQNEYSDSHREVTSFDLYASDSTSSFSLKLLDGASLAVSGGANPNPERQVSVTNCQSKRYIKFVAKTLQGSIDGYGGIMEIKLYGSLPAPAQRCSGCPYPPGTAPDPVMATTVTACGVRVNWAAANDGGKPILHYTVYATGGGSTDKKLKIVEGAYSNTTFVTGLKRRTQYTFKVSATNEIGESYLGAQSEAVTTQDFRKYIFVSDFPNDRVLRFDFATKLFKDVFVQKGSGGLRKPWGIAFNKFDDAQQPRTFYVASEGTSSILQYDACDGSFVKQFAVIRGEPRGVKFHILPSAHKIPRSQKMLLVASHYGDSILKYNAYTGSSLGTYATGVRRPADIVIGPQSSMSGPGGPSSYDRSPEDIFVSSMSDNAVIQFQNTSGTFKSKFTDKKVNTAFGLAFGQDTAWDGSGRITTTAADSVQTGYLYVVGPYAGKVIVKFDQNNGTYIEHFEDRDLQTPMGMVYHQQTLYLLDGNAIRTYDAETGEFLETFTSHDGMDGTCLLFHDM